MWRSTPLVAGAFSVSLYRIDDGASSNCATTSAEIRKSLTVWISAFFVTVLSIAWKAEHPPAIGAAGLDDLVDVAAHELCHAGGDPGKIRRLVVSTARSGILGEQIGGICFKVQSIQRNGWQGFAKCLAALEVCNPAGDADVEPHRKKSFCFRAVARETVHDAARSVGHYGGEHVVEIGEGVAAVKKKRLAGLYSMRLANPS